MHTIELPYIVAAFVAWVGGRALPDCEPLIDRARRLFPAALRISGWSHTCGGIMKAVCKKVVSWPEQLDRIRCLCRFFRNETWREHLVRCCQGRVPGLAKLLEHFTASVAKWRYETTDFALVSLIPLRLLCETCIRVELFTNAQDKEFIKEVILACECRFFGGSSRRCTPSSFGQSSIRAGGAWSAIAQTTSWTGQIIRRCVVV